MSREGMPTKAQAITFAAAWAGWVMDAFDFTAFLLVMPEIEKTFGVKHTASAGAIALTLLMRLVGGYFAGKAADRWGRKLPLLVSVVWFAVCDGAIALAPSFTAILVLRTLFGLGMGAEWTSGTTLAMENWPKKTRGIASGVLQGSWAVGYLLAAAVSAFVVPRFGWRALFVVTALPALLVLPLRSWVPESEEWKKVAKARPEPLRVLFAKHEGLLGRAVWGALAMSVGFGAYYALTGLYPTILKVELGLGAHETFVLVALFNVGMMLGAIVSGVVAAKRSVALAIVVPAGLSVLVMPLYVGHPPSHLGVGAFLGGAFGAGFCGVTPMLLTTMFPAEARARLVGITYHVGAFVAGFLPLATATLAERAGTSLGFAVMIVTSILELCLVVLVLATLGRTRAPSPEDAHADLEAEPTPGE
ncbi:MAG: MFS transporter [Myxococcales bacterium]|nr:MFS transporter [Myxococcales bacterium]